MRNLFYLLYVYGYRFIDWVDDAFYAGSAILKDLGKNLNIVSLDMMILLSVFSLGLYLLLSIAFPQKHLI